MIVVNLRKERYSVYIGRPSIFGNPHPLGIPCSECVGYPRHSREECIRLYEEMARNSPELMKAIRKLPENARLGCYCAPLPCHGDVIVKLWRELNGVPEPHKPTEEEWRDLGRP